MPPHEAAKLRQLGHLAAQKAQLHRSLYTIEYVKLRFSWLFSPTHLRGQPVGLPPVECYLVGLMPRWMLGWV